MTRKLNFIAPLFVPGDRPERFEKAAASGADAIIIDLEDAVPAEAKVAARSALRADFTALPILVRINGAGTPWHRDDLAAVLDMPFAAAKLRRIVAEPEIQERFRDLSAVPVGSSPAELAARVKAELAKGAPVVQSAGLKQQM